ncbi:MAG: hypothetical protein Q7J54_00325, partial [Candidatus Woesearchaeota archaeon]|nr:hypothetical protein [Candidatus Woesearchaeota archaeon]
KTLISKIAYSPETIKISFISRSAEGGRATEENPAPPLAGLGYETNSSRNLEFASYFVAPVDGYV